MSRRDYKVAVREAQALDDALRSGQQTPLVSPYTPDRKTGKGTAAAKTLTQAVKQAEHFATVASNLCKDAAAHRDAAEKACAEAHEVCGRAVMVCVTLSVCAVAPWVGWLACHLLG